MTRRTAGATRHTCVVTVFTVFILLNVIVHDGWQVNFCNLRACCGFCRFSRNYGGFFYRSRTNAHFL